MRVVKPTILHFARTARALTGRYMHKISEVFCPRRSVLSAFPAARARASYWFDKYEGGARAGGANINADFLSGAYSRCARGCKAAK